MAGRGQNPNSLKNLRRGRTSKEAEYFLKNRKKEIDECFSSIENLRKKINEYFSENQRWSVEGLILKLKISFPDFEEKMSKDDAMSILLQESYLKIKDKLVIEITRVSDTKNIDGNIFILKNMNLAGMKYEI